MANESVAVVRPIDPTPTRRQELEGNAWTCDYETLRALWEAQAICKLIDNEMDGGEFDKQAVQLAVQGVDRLLAGAIKRTGWDGLGWEKRR